MPRALLNLAPPLRGQELAAFGQQELAQQRMKPQPAPAAIEREDQHVAGHEVLQPPGGGVTTGHMQRQLGAELPYERNFGHELHQLWLESRQHATRQPAGDIPLIT